MPNGRVAMYVHTSMSHGYAHVRTHGERPCLYTFCKPANACTVCPMTHGGGILTYACVFTHIKMFIATNIAHVWYVQLRARTHAHLGLVSIQMSRLRSLPTPGHMSQYMSVYKQQAKESPNLERHDDVHNLGPHDNDDSLSSPAKPDVMYPVWPWPV